jgi:hypothetical protein
MRVLWHPGGASSQRRIKFASPSPSALLAGFTDESKIGAVAYRGRYPASVSHASTDDSAHVDVELTGDLVERGEPPRPRRRNPAWAVVTIVSLALIWLLVTDSATDLSPPESPSPSSADRSTSEALPMGWATQGNLADDEAVLAGAETAWRTAAETRRDWGPPGLDLNAIWAGEIDDRSYVLLESAGYRGEGLVAKLSTRSSPSGTHYWSVDQVVRIYSEPPFLVLGTSVDGSVPRARILPNPSLLEQGLRFSRVASGRYERIAVRTDGISEELLLADSSTEVVALRGVGRTAIVASASSMLPMRMIPEESSLRFVRPHWGGVGTTTAQDYLDALAALRATGRSHAWVYMAGSSTDAQRRLSLVAVWPFYEGWPDIVAVATDAGHRHVSQPRATLFGQEVVMGKVTVDDSDMVIAAASPRAHRVSILLDGVSAADGSRVATAVIPAGTGGSISAEAYRANGAVLDRARMAPREQVRPLESTQPTAS